MESKIKFSRFLEALDISKREFLVLCILFSMLFVAVLIKTFFDYHIGSRDIELLYKNPEEFQVQLDINRAEWYELTALPQIGEKRAKAIVEYRQNNRPFNSLEDLLDVKGINPAILEEIKTYITVGDADEKETLKISN
jgi:competence ComEA-like helix-hairpin-helix protein